jgi:poly(hydroxyalkanoate) depolymerase family esterase
MRKASGQPGDWGALTPLSTFGSNPGEIEAGVFVPPGLAPGAPLVAVLHGCTQTSSGYDRGSGWSDLAAEHGFALLFPQQNRSNNPNLCFNWFVPGDVTRGLGEAESIRQMIAAMIAAHGLDRRRIFITGLSAGGAMTASMLATSPEIFAGGAIIAGVPHAAASNVNEAFERMRGQGLPDAAAAAATIRAASHHNGPWPRLSVWHGSADPTVDPANADAIAAGWARLQDLGAPVTQTVDGHRRLVWRDAEGDAIESFTINGMGHGTPITARGDAACGTPMPHMLETGISSTRHIAAFWGIAPAVAPSTARAPLLPTAMAQMPAGGVADVINVALRQAGLMR